MSTLEEILKERHSEYGCFETQSIMCQQLKKLKKECTNWEELPEIVREAIEMITVKESRILNGNCHHEDTWRDIAGYATLVADYIKRERSREGDC